MNLPKKIGFIGLGHIGGSIAKTIHRFYPEIQQIAFDTDTDTLGKALNEEVISTACKEITDDFRDCDYVYLCAPVLDNDAYIPKLTNIIHDRMVLTDIGSVKTRIHEKIRQYPELERHFIGGHPMCGTEHTGYDYSSPNMLENAYYVLTPSDTVDPKLVSDMRDFIDSIGALPIVLNYREHDHIVGSVSHLPHIISATLVNMVKETDDKNETMRTVAAGGFRDITRISSSSPVMWENICIANHDELLRLIDDYIARITASRERVAKGDPKELMAFFQSAKDYRDSFNISRGGAISPVFQLFCYIDDQPGRIAEVTAILASAKISIKNIGIIHNREYEEGVLQLEFYQRSDYDKAVPLLKKYHYTVYEDNR